MRKLLLVLLGALLIIGLIELVVYFKLTYGGNFSVSSEDSLGILKVSNKSKWNYFKSQIAIEEEGFFVIFSPVLIIEKYKSIEYRLVANEQINRFKNSDKTIYSYDFGYDKKSSKLSILISIPNNYDQEELNNNLNTAILLISYRLFTGQVYNSFDEKIAQFKSLDDLGLRYVKK